MPRRRCGLDVVRDISMLWTAWEARKGVRQPGTQGRHMEWHADGTLSEGRSGLQGNVHPLRIYQEMFLDQVDKDGKPIGKFQEKSSIRLVSYGGTLFNQLGVYTVTCAYQHTSRGDAVLCHRCPWSSIYRSTVAGGVHIHLTQVRILIRLRRL